MQSLISLFLPALPTEDYTKRAPLHQQNSGGTEGPRNNNAFLQDTVNSPVPPV